MSFLENIVKEDEIVKTIEPKHITSTLSVARYFIETSYIGENTSWLSTIIDFIKEIGLINKSLEKTCKWILENILKSNLEEYYECEAIIALSYYDKTIETHNKWRKHCTSQLQKIRPFIKGKSIYPIKSVHYFGALKHLKIINDKNLIIDEIMRFVDSQNLEEIHEFLLLLKHFNTNISIKSTNKIKNNLSQIESEVHSDEHKKDDINKLLKDIQKK